MKAGRFFVQLCVLFTCHVLVTPAKADDNKQQKETAIQIATKLKLHCDPFAPADMIKMDKKGNVAKDKDGKLQITKLTEKDITEQRKKCDNKKIREYIEPLYLTGPDSDGEGEGGADRTKPILIGPPDGSAYYGVPQQLWLGTLWDPVPGAAHILCIAKDHHFCPPTPRGVVGRRSDPDHYADMVEGGSAVREMPHFCYTQDECVWSVAACFENSVGNWSCEYAEPFWTIRVTH